MSKDMDVFVPLANIRKVISGGGWTWARARGEDSLD